MSHLEFVCLGSALKVPKPHLAVFIAFRGLAELVAREVGGPATADGKVDLFGGRGQAVAAAGHQGTDEKKIRLQKALS